jgi:hypothetical protein
VLLRQLRDAAPAPIFGDLAQDALHACRAAVAGAAESIRARASLDGALFAVRHLLLLKELAGGLELAQRAEEDAPGASGGVVSDTLASVLTRTSALIPSALFASLGMPRADENIGDAKLGIDQDLKAACEEVIALVADNAAAPLRAWTARVRVHLDTAGPAAPAPEWADPAPVDVAFRAAWGPRRAPAGGGPPSAPGGALAGAARAVALYVGEPRAAGALLGHARTRVEDEYAGFADAVVALRGSAARAELLGEAELGALVRAACEDG